MPTPVDLTRGPLAVQEVKDIGRTPKHITLDGYQTVGTAEVLNTLSFSSALGAVTTGTSYNVSAGKTLRIKGLIASLMTTAGNTTPATVIVRLRTNAAGAAVIGSPLQAVFSLEGVTAANNGASPVALAFGNGIELPAGAGLGLTTACPGWVVTTAAPLVNITLLAFEY